jgi:hypothetical protein
MEYGRLQSKTWQFCILAFLAMIIQISILASLPLTNAVEGPPSSYFYSTYTPMLASIDLLEYPSVFDGYLWVIASNPWPVLLKCNLTTQEVINSTVLPHVSSYSEYFSAFVYRNLVFVPGEDGQTDLSNGQIAILNENTLMLEATYTIPNTIANFVVSALYDKVSDNLLFGLDTQDGTVSIAAVSASQATNTSAYRIIQISNVSGAETQVVTFNNTVYVLATYPCGGVSGTVHTTLYSSNDLSNWTQIFDKTGINVEPGGYFGHLTASSDYLAIGLISNETTGVTTHRITYMNKTGIWKEFDSYINDTRGEDHPSVNALSSDLFLWEPSARFRSKDHTIYVLNATSGQMTELFTPTASKGYNDRWIGIDVENNILYIPDCYAPGIGSQIIKVNWNLQLTTPDYYPIKYRIHAIADKHSSIRPEGITLADPGDNITFEYSSSPGYTITDIKVNGSSVPISSNYQFTNISNNYFFSIHSDTSPIQYATIAGIPYKISAGSTLNSINVTLYDAKNNIITAYNGTLYFKGTDSKATYPYTETNNYTFSSADNGSHTFSGFTFRTSGTQTITINNEAESVASFTFTVTPGQLNYTTITPANATITAGDRIIYQSKGWDTYNNLMGNTTASTAWNISSEAGGTWESNVYKSEKAGIWIITANISNIQQTTSLTVRPAPTPMATDKPIATTDYSNSPNSTINILILIFALALSVSIIAYLIRFHKKTDPNNATQWRVID